MHRQMNSPSHNHKTEVQRYFWRNYLAHCIEGGLYMGGLAFVAAETVLPAMVKSLGGPNWLISLTPMMLMFGIGWPSLLTAHYVEQLPKVKPFILATGFLQRLPYLVAALSLLFLIEEYPVAVLYLVAFAPFISGGITGLNFAAWMQLISRIIPENRRASSWAIRYIIAAAIGISAGSIIRFVLSRSPGPSGYGRLHLIAFGFCMLSYVLQAMLHEIPPSGKTSANRRSFRENLRSLPGLVKLDRRFRDFICMRMLTMGIYIMTPFLAIHTLDTLAKGEDFLGALVMAQMLGGIVGNLLAGYIGDRYGGRLPLVMARLILISVSLGAALNHSEWGFMVIFFLLGAGFYIDQVGIFTLSIEISPADRIPTYISLLWTLSAPSMLVAAAISTVVRELTGQLMPAAFLSGIAVFLSLIFLQRIKEPRSKNVY
jgi:MFS family permease